MIEELGASAEGEGADRKEKSILSTGRLGTRQRTLSNSGVQLLFHKVNQQMWEKLSVAL